MAPTVQKPVRIKSKKTEAAAGAKGNVATGGSTATAHDQAAHDQAACDRDWTEEFYDIWDSVCDLLIERKYDDCFDACHAILKKPHPRFLRVKCFLAMAMCELKDDLSWADHWIKVARRFYAHLPKVYDRKQQVFIEVYARLGYEVEFVANEVKRYRLVKQGKIKDKDVEYDMAMNEAMEKDEEPKEGKGQVTLGEGEGKATVAEGEGEVASREGKSEVAVADGNADGMRDAAMDAKEVDIEPQGVGGTSKARGTVRGSACFGWVGGNADAFAQVMAFAMNQEEG
ncbi:hypothetical protein KVT40_005752 [Elsinoe batatas]|uniref:Uncharacterized protein n=1 Tax=Elsinoe batatas TaxID=2601811 RepID=A0A8K0PFR1_9PEZI|nr:hypothetical protein KVT40_005752 [Elsinoe batatas]